MVHIDLGKYVANLSSLEFCDQDLLVEEGFVIGSRFPVPFVYVCPLVAVRAICDPYVEKANESRLEWFRLLFPAYGIPSSAFYRSVRSMWPHLERSRETAELLRFGEKFRDYWKNERRRQLGDYRKVGGTS